MSRKSHRPQRLHLHSRPPPHRGNPHVSSDFLHSLSLCFSLSLATMDELQQLQYLSLVSKVCSELDNHLGVSDKTLAEFIIDLAQRHPQLADFCAALEENGAEFPPSFAQSLLSLVGKMMPKKSTKSARSTNHANAPGAGPQEKYAGLAIPNDSDERRRQLESEALGESSPRPTVHPTTTVYPHHRNAPHPPYFPPVPGPLLPRHAFDLPPS